METFITIEDKARKSLVIVDFKTKKIVWAEDESFKKALSEILAIKPRLRKEIFGNNGDIITCLREIEEGDALYPEAFRQELERRGFFAQIVSAKAARTQKILRNSYLPQELQDKIVYRLPRMTDDQVDEILKELNT